MRHFSTPETREAQEDQIWMFSNEYRDGDERLTNIKNVCTRRYLYSPIDDSGRRDFALEEKLADMETELASFWPRVATELLDYGEPSIRRLIALFVSVMHLRSPDSLDAVEGIHRSLVSLYESAPRHPDGTPNVEVLDASGRPQPLDTKGWEQYRTAGANDHKRFFASMIQAQAVHIAQHLLQKRWSTLFASDDAFVTSDRPVSVQHQSRQVFGVATVGSIVIFPLTPQRLLVMDDRHDQPANQFYPLNSPSLGPMNGLIWRNGRLLLTGRPIPEVLEEIVASAHESVD